MNEWMNEKRCEIRLAPASWSVDGRFLFFFVVVVCYQHHFQSLAFHRAQKWNSDRGTLMANSRIVFSPKKQDGADTIRRPLRMSPVENENAELKREKNERKMNAGTAWGRLFWASRGHGPVTSIFVIVAGVVSAPSRRGLVGVKFPRETKLNGNVSDSTRQNPKFQAPSISQLAKKQRAHWLPTGCKLLLLLLFFGQAEPLGSFYWYYYDSWTGYVEYSFNINKRHEPMKYLSIDPEWNRINRSA